MGESAAKYRPELDLDEFERRLRAAAPMPQSRQPAASAPDPLAELARLVGGAGEGRQDPFEALFRAQKAVSEGAPPVQAPHEPYFGQAEPARRADHFAAESDPHWVEEPPRVDAPWASQAPEFAPDTHAFAQQAPRPGIGRRKVMYAMAAVLVGGVALFAGGLALKKGSSSGEVVTIQADSDPAKVKPAVQESAANGSGQALFDRKDDNAPAKVVSKSEQAADLTVAAKQAQATSAAAIATPAPPAPGSAAPSSATSGSAGPQQGGEAPPMAPKKVKTVSIRADGSLLNAADAKPRSTLPTLAAGGPGAAPPIPVARPAPPRAPSTTEAALQAKPKAKPEPAAAAAPAASGDWAVQLAGAPTEEEARAAASRYAEKYAAALQGRHPTFVSAQVGAKTIYRVRVGHMSKEAANSMCNAIKGQGGACFTAKN
ncbi:hypothetical protein CCR94_19915 [Rhodoblastus sphagnicola]|uniref:Uncharacterized protein n=1 Tax=Rhodoblastus sphagnicola TaxID=333368 RepID=A0A2S6MYQ9_9HYPH|nr:SPOR domain-containing protein [Rhodoblastus sphagnicola]MBB4196468.1 hypothetical protein [Rhodoblastus sphagnicola]PPQ27497.1 hypothetical protein CCR94_19915 [Rhodoblastus sphagnicola]